ncbi:MAG: biopolymer transporter ExbD [Planctomycetes bacterium]|nr:biopolymer transporter ExbD [Planctomycetota bacterium]
MNHADAEIDLVPMIDCIFLLLLFFMLCGRITVDQRTEQITVPPTKTAAKFKDPNGWTREIVNLFGATQHGAADQPPRNSIRIGTHTFNASGVNDYSGYKGLRQILDAVYDKAEKYDDPKKTGMRLPKVIIEIRADGDTEYRVVQEVQQVLTDTLDLENMQPKKGLDPKTARAFVNIDFTTRRPEDKM